MHDFRGQRSLSDDCATMQRPSKVPVRGQSVCAQVSTYQLVLAMGNDQGPVVRKVDSAIHRIVIFSTVVKMLEKL